MNRRERRAAAAANRGEVRVSPASAIVHSTRDGYAYAPDGERFVVARPKRPDVALAAAELALRHQDEALFQAIPDDDYALMGYLSADGKTILHPESGAPIGTLERGDSLITLSPPSEN
jgi:hypothetical protein